VWKKNGTDMGKRGTETFDKKQKANILYTVLISPTGPLKSPVPVVPKTI
jgi:hypothetical protein